MSLQNSVCDLFAAMSANCNSEETNNLDSYEFSIISCYHAEVSCPVSRPSHCRGSCSFLFGSENLDESCRLTPPMAGGQVGMLEAILEEIDNFMETKKDSRLMLFYANPGRYIGPQGVRRLHTAWSGAQKGWKSCCLKSNIIYIVYIWYLKDI